MTPSADNLSPPASATCPRVLAVLPGFIPSTMITVVKPLVSLHRAGRITARVVLESQASRKDVAWAQAIVFCRNTKPRYGALLAAARASGKRLIYDLDDNLFEVPADCDSARLGERGQQSMLEEYLRSAALVRVYSQPLADRVAALNPRVVRTFAPVDLALVPAEGEKRPSGPIKIAYATSRTRDALCEIFLPALARILERHAGRVEAHFWGCRPRSPARGRPAGLANIHYHGLICQYDRYLRCFSRSGQDIGLAPLPDNDFYRSKTNNKFREYAASGVAGIYSRMDVYSQCVEHEVTGILVSNDAEDWYWAMERLIEDEPLRTRIQRRARQYVRENYAQAKFEDLFLEQVHEVLAMPAESLPSEHDLPADAAGRVPTAGYFLPTAGYFRRLGDQAWRSLGTAQRLGPRLAWTALRWFVSNRCQAAWLRWQLGRR